MPTLYIVATPIGNLEDISLRALRILKEVALVAAEDTRKTKFLLTRYDIKTPTTSYHEHNKLTKLPYILGKLESDDVALVSEAGMPGISDPGYELVVAAIEQGVNVVPIPGASATTTALAVSGLPTDRFLFIGFLPARAASRRKALESVANERSTIIIYEAPHRVIATLKDVLTLFGDRRIAVCRELTKFHEQVFRGTVSQAIAEFSNPRGEFTLVIEGSTPGAKAEPTVDVEKLLGKLRRSGLPASEAIPQAAAETGLSRRELYRVWIRQT